jgi:pilus retraction protein PilT
VDNSTYSSESRVHGDIKSRLDSELESMISSGASDLHLGADRPTMIRVDGSLRSMGNSAWTAEEVIGVLKEITTPVKWKKFEEDLELDFSYTTPSGVRFRTNIYYQQNLLGGAFRFVAGEIKSLADLGLESELGSFANLSRGLILVTGPTGSGKSTTLAAILNEINQTRADHIMTIEDPIEFIHKGKKGLVNQREVGTDTASFGSALRHILRQDPDVILIGEMRDFETISAALTAAETGHLVLGTLHTRSASQTVDRIIDVFPPHQQAQIKTQLASALQAIVCQTLIPRIEGVGRVVATEILTMTTGISNMIREGKTFQIPSAMQAGREFGMHTMDQSLAGLVRARLISLQAAEDLAHDRGSLDQLIQSGQGFTPEVREQM